MGVAPLAHALVGPQVLFAIDIFASVFRVCGPIHSSELPMRCFLLAALMLAALPAAAEVPARAFPSVADTGPLREQPQALSHWQKMAEDMADRAAPELISRRVAVSSHAYGQSSVFDAAFHDFFITALHARGVPVTANAYGARVELDTYPVNFKNSRRTARVVNPDRYGERFVRGLADELAVNVRVFDGGDLAFSGSYTYYLPPSDLGKYRTSFQKRTVEPAHHHQSRRSMHGEYGTATWGCLPETRHSCR